MNTYIGNEIYINPKQLSYEEFIETQDEELGFVTSPEDDMIAMQQQDCPSIWDL